MAGFGSWLIANTDPVTAGILVIHLAYTRRIEKSMDRNFKLVRDRIKRVESAWFEDDPEPEAIRADD